MVNYLPWNSSSFNNSSDSTMAAQFALTSSVSSYLISDTASTTCLGAESTRYLETCSTRLQKQIESNIYGIWQNDSDCRYSTWKDSTAAYTFSPYNWGNIGSCLTPRPPKPSERLRAMIQARQAPLIITTRKPLDRKIDEREQRARDTLRRLVGENQYRRFLAHGFITARGKSGKAYQIKPGHGVTSVYSPTGEPIENLCVVLRGNFPPTDEAITRYLMILNDEDHFRSLAVVSRHYNPNTKPRTPDQRPLPEIFRAFKEQAA